MERNRWAARCVRCPASAPPLPAGAGDLHHPRGHQPYITCAYHTLLEGVPPPTWFDEIIATFPREDPFKHGKELKPYPYQIEDARRLATVRATLVGSQMGTGKTPVTCLGALRADLGNVIFCPASVKWNWKREIERWRPDLCPVVATNRRAWEVPGPGVVMIGSWGLIPGEPCAKCKVDGFRACTHPEDQDLPLPDLTQPLILIADEVHYLQRPTTARRQRWDLFSGRVWNAGGRLYGLTGTVASNSPWDLYEILKALMLERAVFTTEQDFVTTFKDWLLAKKGERSLPAGEQREELLKSLRPVRICRLRKHVLTHLPPVQEKIIRVELDKKTIAEVDEAVQKMLATKRAWEDVEQGIVPNPWGKAESWDGEKKRKIALSDDERARRMGLWQERVDFYYQTRPWHTDEELRNALKAAIESKNEVPHISELARIRSMLALAKLTTALELVEKHEGEGEPLLVFSQHVAVLEKMLGGRSGWGLYNGSVSQKKRDEIVQAFQAGEIEHGIGISITAGGEGINLTRAGSVMFIDAHWNPAKNDQAGARVIRPGAEIHDSITIWRLVANHAVDRLLWTTLHEKGALMALLEDDEASLAGLAELEAAAA